MDERRASTFAERLSLWVVFIAALGAFMVLIDMKATVTISGQVFQIGGDGFSSELKGAVITIMLIGGWTAVMGFWLGQSDSGQQQARSMSRIAEQAPNVAAAVVAAATGTGGAAQQGTITTDTVTDTANVTGEVQKP